MNEREPKWTPLQSCINSILYRVDVLYIVFSVGRENFDN